jgi:hypothetical protein
MLNQLIIALIFFYPMFCDLVSKLFDLQIHDEDQAKKMIISYAQSISPDLTDNDILHIVYRYNGQYSFEQTVVRASKEKKGQTK